MATFAELAAQPYGDKGIGLMLAFYNYDTSTNWAFNVSNHPRFAPGYSPILSSISNVSYGLTFLAPLTQIADLTFKLLNTTVHNSPAGQTRLSDQFAAGYSWFGKTVTLRLLAWDEVAATTRYAGIWQGYLTECRHDDATITFTAVATANWKLASAYSGSAIAATDYPDSGPDSVGQYLPIVFGDNQIIPWGSGLGAYYEYLAMLMGLADRRRMVPAVLVDRNLNSSDGPVYVPAEHALKTFEGPETDADAANAHLTMSGTEVTCPTRSWIAASGTPSTATFDDPVRIVVRCDVTESASTNTITNPHNVGDKDDSTYAQTDGTHLICALDCQSPYDLGQVVQVDVAVLETRDFEATEKLCIGIWDNEAADWWGGYGELTGTQSTATPSVYTVSDHVTVNKAGDFPNDFSLRVEHVDFESGSFARIYELCLLVTYKTGIGYWREVTTKLMYTRGPDPLHPLPRWALPWMRVTAREGWQHSDVLPDKVYVSCEGMADAAGIYQGSAGLLLETPVAIAAYIAGQADVDLGGTPGALATARGDQAADSITARLAIAKKVSARDLIADLCQQSVAGALIHTGIGQTIGFVYWGSDAADNLYGTPINGADILEFEAGWTPLEQVRNAIYVHCEYDYRLGKCVKMAYCDGAGSDDGEGNDTYAECAKLADSESYYQRRELTLQAYTLTLDGAVAVRDQLADMLYQPRAWLRMKLPWSYYTLEAGHVIELDNDTCIAAGYKYPGQTDSEDGLWSHGAQTRYFWVERVTFSEDGYIEIEATEGVWA